jgi:hypothetical protein
MSCPRRVVLVGDAACCAAPTSGMGTTQAFLAARTLARALRELDIGDALSAYEQWMRPIAGRNQELGLEGAVRFGAQRPVDPTKESSTRIDATFEILDWQEEVYDEPTEGPKLTQVIITKRYAGEINGEGVARLFTTQGSAGGGYIASERVTGEIAGRRGSFVIQHGGLADGDFAAGTAEQTTWGSIVPGSATGELTGLVGRASEQQHGVLTLDYTRAR